MKAILSSVKLKRSDINKYVSVDSFKDDLVFLHILLRTG